MKFIGAFLECLAGLILLAFCVLFLVLLRHGQIRIAGMWKSHIFFDLFLPSVSL